MDKAHGKAIHRTQTQSLSQLQSRTSQPLKAFETSIRSFDEMLCGGFVPGQVYELSGLNNSGKVEVGLQVCKSALEMDKRVLWISMMHSRPVVTHDLETLCDVDHVRISTLGQLYVFLQSFEQISKFSLIILEDFSCCLTRCVGDLQLMGMKSTLEMKLARNVAELLMLNCQRFNSACVMINPVETSNISLVPVVMNNGSKDGKYINQQILVSSLGQEHIWNKIFRARIMLYRDFATNSSGTCIYAHIRHSSSMKKVLASRGVKRQVVAFGLDRTGLVELSDAQHGISKDFTVDESDFISDFDSGAEEEKANESKVGDDNVEENKVQDHQAKILPSSLCGDIQSSREMLSSQLNSNVHEDMERKPHSLSQDEEPTAVNTDQMIPSTRIEVYRDDDPASVTMVEDTSMQELEDELEELFPTQPEAISLDRLTQLTQFTQLQDNDESFNHSKKRAITHDGVFTTSKQRKAMMQLSDGVNVQIEDETLEIPATLPFF